MPELLYLNKPAFETVYEQYYDRVYKCAYMLLLNRENAEDVTADTFLAAYSAYDSYDPARASLSTWLTRIAHNKAVNLVRSAAYRKTAPLPEETELAAPEDMVTRAENADLVERLYRRLTEGERELLNLRYVMELSDQQIGSLLGLETKTVNKRFQRLLVRCRVILEGE